MRHVLQMRWQRWRSPTDEKKSSSVMAWRRAALSPCRLAPPWWLPPSTLSRWLLLLRRIAGAARGARRRAAPAAGAASARVSARAPPLAPPLPGLRLLLRRCPNARLKCADRAALSLLPRCAG
jgi:hypothetical protein